MVAPSSPFDRTRFERGLQALRSLGLVPRHGQDLFYQQGHLAGSDKRRSGELNAAFQSDAKAIILARGGYGLLRFATTLPKPPPKILIGYSDATVLHEYFARADVPSIHGPMLTQLGEDPQALDRLRALLFGDHPEPIQWTPQFATTGIAEGPLRGGNLASLASMCGTALQPQFKGCIVLLEDLNEPPYKLDRLLTQLLLSGALNGAKGFVIGDLTGPNEDPAGRIEAVTERLQTANVPLVFGAPFGHAGRNQPVAFGLTHRLDVENGRLEQLEELTT
ncbi:MAG TPA: LD-carboxypeptidase [Myxococcales bacterium]|nr:LD-carboxypeptidase [Myxococcales bacterium]